MSAIAASNQRGPAAAVAAVLGTLALLTFATFTTLPLFAVAVGVVVATVGIVAHKWLFEWRTLLAGLLLVIFFIPIRRYALPGNLPFTLEPYRLFVAFLILGWIASLLVDPRVRFRRSGLEAPLLVFVAGIVGSVIANPGRVAATSADVAKSLTFFFTFFVVFFMIVSVARSTAVIDLLVKVAVVAGSIVAFFAIVESRTGYNVFNHLSGVLPGLRLEELPRTQGGRGDRLRAVGSAEHAIALSAVLVMLMPLAVYLNRRTRAWWWWGCMGVLLLGALSTVSRTGVVMLVVLALVYLWLRPSETRRLWPAIIPLLVVTHFALPATLGPLKNSFFPKGGLIAEQSTSANTRGSGRIADLGPSLHEAKQHLLIGEGFGTRIVDFYRENAPILDDQWLGTLLETGVVGMFGLAWLFLRAIRRLARRAKDDRTANGWLAVGLAASISSYAVGMLTFDSFAFVQVTFVLFILLAFASIVVTRPLSVPPPGPR